MQVRIAWIAETPKRPPSRVRTPWSFKYKRIAQSVAKVGIIEPLVVVRSPGGGPYMLLDGHVRHAILRDLGERETRCLLASDDEAFTYNKRVNRLATIQEHYMIVWALERGVPRRSWRRRWMLTCARSSGDAICWTGSRRRWSSF